MPPVSTSRAWTATLSPSPKCGPACFAKAMILPSGDQARGDEGGPGGSLTGRLQEPEVRRCAAPPSAGTSQMCEGRGARVARKSRSEEHTSELQSLRHLVC